MELQDLINEVVANAPVDRAGNWLIEASHEFPELFAVITEHVDAPPSALLSQVCKVYPVAMGLCFLPHSLGWIAQLQKFLRDRI